MKSRPNLWKYNIGLLALTIGLFGASCSFKNNSAPIVENNLSINEQTVVQDDGTTTEAEVLVTFPLAEYVVNRTFKVYGQYIQDRFSGYHNAEDVEIIKKGSGYEVLAIADGTVVYKKMTSGYGGLVVIRHQLPSLTVQGIYGHLNLNSVKKNVGQSVAMGEVIGNLGADQSIDTDGERQHLHFGLYKGADINVSGYVSKPEQLVNWLNPTDFFSSYGLIAQTVGQVDYQPGAVTGADNFEINFKYPAGWRIEFIPQLNALNLFTLSGAGPARERSQILIRWFDADNFITLDAVDILSRIEGTIAGRPSVTYIIKKKLGEPDFAYQPAWRNIEHQVTDVRSGEGFTRFYVIAKNPELADEEFKNFIDSISFPTKK